MPTFNGLSHLQYSLDSLFACATPDTATVVVDDVSTDQSVSYVESHHPHVVVLRRRNNGGFGAAVNQGLRWAISRGFDYVAVCNSDIKVPAGFWQPVVEHLQQNHCVAIAGFREVNTGKVTLPAAIVFSAATTDLPGMLYIARTAAIAGAGFYDESYVMYGEETDLFGRLRSHGWELLQSNIPVWHFVSGTRNQARWRLTWYSYRNRIRYAVKARSFSLICQGVAVSCYYAVFVPRRPARRTWVGTMLKGRLGDEFISDDLFRARTRRFHTGNRLLNLLIWASAVTWNILALPSVLFTKSIRTINRP
jgi:GT2 family glycosyltransferase